MSGRKNVVVYTVCEDRSLGASFQLDPTWIKFLDNASFQINVTTTNSEGTFAIEVSNDYAVNEVTGSVTNAGVWTALNLGGTPRVEATDTQIIIDLNQLGFKAMRVAYTSTVAGTGTCSAYLTAKEIG